MLPKVIYYEGEIAFESDPSASPYTDLGEVKKILIAQKSDELQIGVYRLETILTLRKRTVIEEIREDQ